MDGTQTCGDGVWTSCVGGIVPTDERCDGKDNDCDGCVDEGLGACTPLGVCPDSDEARPFTDYVLDAAELIGEDETAGVDIEWLIRRPRETEGEVVLGRVIYTLDQVGDHIVELDVSDAGIPIYECEWVIRAVGPGLNTTLAWDTFGATDLDLHLHRSGTTADWCSGDDCFFANCQSGGDREWGYAPSSPDVCSESACPNPRLDQDNISGFVPESNSLDNPADGDVFRVMAHVFSNFSGADVHPTMAIYCGGELTGFLGEAGDQVTVSSSGSSCMGDTWRAADVAVSVDAETGAVSCDVTPLEDDSGDWLIRTDDRSY